MITFAGIDGEMSGCSYTEHVLIQIGVTLSETESFSSRIGWSNCKYDQVSLEVIGLKPEDLTEGPSAVEVDQKLVEWVTKMGIEKEEILPVGWAVGTFDVPFIKCYLPCFSEYLHRHFVDLNAIVYYLGDLKSYLGSRPNAAGWKKMSNSFVDKYLWMDGQCPQVKHDARSDAMAAFITWKWLRNILIDNYPGNTVSDNMQPAKKGRILCKDATKGSWLGE